MISAAIIFIACSQKKVPEQENNKVQASPALPVDVVVARHNSSQQKEVVAGSLIANRIVNITGEISKKIVAVYFKDGSFVSKGSLLFKLDDTDIKAKLRQLQADLDLALINERRMAALLKTESVRREEYEIAYAKLQSLQAAKDLLLSELSKTDIRAPFSGILGMSNAFTGTYVMPGTTLVTLQEEHVLKVQFQVAEQLVNQLKKGATIHFSTVTEDQKIAATVIATDAILNNESRTLLVHAVSTNKNGKLKPGMSAKVYINSGADTKSVSVPTEAVIPGEKGYSVFIVANNIAKLMPVHIADRNEREVIIQSGIRQGDSVLVSNLLRVSEGTPLQIVSSHN